MAKGHDEKGRFVKGHKINEGRKHDKSVRDELRDVIRQAISKQELHDWTRKIMETSMESGDHRAFQAIIAYLVGRPIQMVEAEVDLRGELGERELAVLESVYGTGDSGSSSGDAEEPA